MKTFNFLVAIFLAQNAFAYGPCIGPAVLDHCQDISELIHKTAVFGDRDKRHFVEAYARLNRNKISEAELKTNTAATGELNCNGVLGSAQLTFKNNILTTAAHLLYDPESCKQRSTPDQCEFTYLQNGKKQFAKVESISKVQLACPLDTNQQADWIVLKLDKPIEGVKPYKIPEPATGSNLKEGQNVIAVARSFDFCARDVKGNCLRGPDGIPITPKYVMDCHLGNIQHAYGQLLANSDCDGGIGASGGSILDTNLHDPTLLAMQVGVQGPSQDESRNEARSGKPMIKAFNNNFWTKQEVPVTGDFLNAILAAGK